MVFARIGNNEIIVLVNDVEKGSDINPLEVQQILLLPLIPEVSAEDQETTQLHTSYFDNSTIEICLNMNRSLCYST
ncbi:hypothetical protein R3W88_016019 [Solanum pinnatisectum]|uniref:Uncharacterized protein n=1 Tax=Solanum pinnatisectum TaxID=50273 RepID=A0AAV9KWL5_9SOLN|nr:hypothetical protein R3W88_016019 [Solanum pinnatisectum]